MNRKLAVSTAVCAAAVMIVAGCSSSQKTVSAAGGGGKSAHTYGDCKVTGTYGSNPISPAAAGALTVETSLPSPGWGNGDTPTRIQSG